MQEKTRYWLLLLACIFLSISGVFVGFLTREPANGARGGAIAVMIALVALFLSRQLGTRVYKILTHELWGDNPEEQLGPLNSDISDIRQKVKALSIRLDLDAEAQRVQSVFLAWATAVSTIAWGFGDLASKWLIENKPAFLYWICGPFVRYCFGSPG